MEGMLLIDKPTGWTSFDAVNHIRHIVARAESRKPKSVKVGHCGTLDPFATGLLIVLIGKKYTRLAEQYSKMDKTYEASLRLGQTSSTGDPEGEITEFSTTVPDETSLIKALEKFKGEIKQIPPAYSAIKINGERAYKLARAGKEVKIEPRLVTIHELTLISYKYPEVNLRVNVSSGTYIRSLVEDIGQDLSCGAYTKTLRRLTIGEYDVDQASQIDSLTYEKLSELVVTID
jgi:tRNA pseudouridine55 synthase